MIRIFLNNTLTTYSPKDTDSLVEDLTRNEESKGYIYQISGNLTFQGNDYDYLRGLYDSNYCTDLPIEIQYSVDGNVWQSKIKGLIKLASVEWDIIKREASCPVTDNNFLSKINNNKSIKFELGTEKDITQFPILSKNGVDVSYKYIFHDNIQMFSPLWKRYFENEAAETLPNNEEVDLRPAGRRGIFIYDALNLIIALMSDDEVGFASNYFTYDLTTPNNYIGEAFSVLMSGMQLRTGTSVPYISFVDLFEDLHKLFNVWFAIEIDINGKPVIRIEDENYFNGINSNAYFNNVESMVEKLNFDKLYAKISVGCSEQDETFPIEDIPLLLHGKEEYGLTGTCNTDNALDLELKTLIINTNSICLTLPPIVGFNTGTSKIDKYSTEATSAPSYLTYFQKLTDSSADFEVNKIDRRYILHETLYDKWTYVTNVNSNLQVQIYDEVFVVDDPSTGIYKNYEIFQPASFDSYDERVFLVQGDRDTSDAATFYALSSSIVFDDVDVWYYNPDFGNYKVIERHLGGISQDLISNLSDGNDQFNAGVVASSAAFSPVTDPMYHAIIFDDDSTGPTYFDTNGNYNNTDGFYVVPQNGYYHAACQVNISNVSPLTINLIYQVELSHLNADLTPKSAPATQLGYGYSFSPIGVTFNLEKTFACDAGDRICVIIKNGFDYNPLSLSYVSWTNTGANIRPITYTPAPPVASYFTVDALLNGGGLITPSDPGEVRIVEVESQLSLTRDEFDGIISNPFDYYHINYGEGLYKSGYIKSASRDILSGTTTMTLLKKQNGV
jgi:hypothetical protein